MTRAVLFDLDGTLADTAPDLGFALNRQREHHGLPPLPLEAIRPHASHGARGLLEAGFGLFPGDPEFIAFRDEFLDLYAERLCQDTRLFPGMEALLAALESDGIPWGIVTNKSTRLTEPLLASLALRERAACIVCGDTCARAKPHPDPLLEASRMLAIPPAACVYLGDDRRDMEAGLAAGMRVAVAGYGYLGVDSDPVAWGAHFRIESPQELLAHL